MKYIKKFENIWDEDKFYWLVPTDNRFEDSLKKIGVGPDWCSKFLNNNKLLKNKYIFIGRTTNIKNDYYWCWMPYEGKIICNFYEEDKYMFMGDINIKDEELDAEKYNL